MEHSNFKEMVNLFSIYIWLIGSFKNIVVNDKRYAEFKSVDVNSAEVANYLQIRGYELVQWKLLKIRKEYKLYSYEILYWWIGGHFSLWVSIHRIVGIHERVKAHLGLESIFLFYS